MPKNKKYTPNLQKKLNELKKSRNKIEEFQYNFFGNFSEHCKFMHHQIKTRVSDEMFSVSYRQYFVFLVSSLETFFRDTFVFLVSNDEEIANEIIYNLKIKKAEIAKIKSNKGIAEFLSACFNFQNFNDIDMAFSNILGKNFWDYIQTYTIEKCANQNRIGSFSLSEIFTDWQDILTNSFEIRHRIIHDANFRPPKDILLVQKAEAIILTLPQIVTYSFSKNFNLEYTVLSFRGEISGLYLFSIDDILAEDWVVCKENEFGLRHTMHR